MAVLVILICFTAIFFNTGILLKQATAKKELFIITVLILCGFVVLITELLSLFQVLNFKTILLSWIAIASLNLSYLCLHRYKVKLFYANLKQKLNEVYQRIKTKKVYEKCLLISVLVILLLVFIQSIIYPPNIADAITYHLARIPSWISHQSVAHYPTSVIRQIYQPPFAEYVIMHINVLTRTDVFSGSVQFSFLLSSIISLIAIVEAFNLNSSYKILTVFLVLTIPEVVLQASSTQNDLVISFFVITSFYFVIKTVKEFSLKNSFFFGLAVGLGILTKATAYIYMPAIMLIFGITMLNQLFTFKNYKYLWYALFAAVIFFTVNFGFYYRNYKLTSNLLGIDQNEFGTYSNEKTNVKLLILSVVKNVGNHVGLLHLKPLSVITAKTIIKLHQIMGVDINDPANNYFHDLPYTTLYFPAHPDLAPNFVHLLLIIITLVILIIQLFKKKNKLIINLLTFTVIFQWTLFCFYLKYQPYHTRLHTPLFLLAVPLICYGISIANIKWKQFFYYTTPLIFSYALMIVLSNTSQPYNNTISKNRYEKYFINRFFLYDEYNIVNKTARKSGYKNIGLIMNDADWEYSLFTDCYSRPLNPVYLDVNNYTKNSEISVGQVDCIITSALNEHHLDYKGKRFYNQNPKYKFIHLYK